MKKNNKLILAAVAAAALVAILAGVYLTSRPTAGEGDKTITVEVVHKDQSTKTFTYETDAEYLGQVIQDEGLVEGEMGEYGLFIQVVDGERADYDVDGGYWALYQGEAHATQSADLTPIHDGDEFSLVYTVG